ncbi:MAG: hypothetical protein ACE5JN_15350 [Candidatus Methylomirabilia bacterium]
MILEPVVDSTGLSSVEREDLAEPPGSAINQLPPDSRILRGKPGCGRATLAGAVSASLRRFVLCDGAGALLWAGTRRLDSPGAPA